MQSILKFVLVLSLSFAIQNVTAQVDLNEFPKKIKSAYKETEKNGGCSFFDYSIDNITIVNPNCAGEETGTACIEIPSITPADNYSVIWSGPDGHPEDGATTPCISGLGAGTWVAAVFNEANEGCVVVVEITEPSAMTILNWGIEDVTLRPPSCFGICDGLADPAVFGGPGDGNGPFEFLYDNGDTTKASSNLCDEFVLNITDSNGCIREFEYDFEDGPEEVLVDSIITNTCFGETTGSIDLDVTGGNPIPDTGYIYSWTNNSDEVISVEQDVSGLGAGTYTVSITDASPCTITKEYTIFQSEEIVTNPTFTEIFCYGETNGEIFLNATGGVSPLSYVWSGSNVQVNAADQSNLPAGDYDIVITDSIGCSISENYTLTAPDSISIEGVVSSVSCFGDANGSIILNVTGGTPPYQSYSWDVPACYSGVTTTPNLTGLCGGIYEVTVVDSDNCSISATFEVLEPSMIVLDLSKSDETCFGLNDGFINMEISGGTQPTNQPVWDPPPFTVDGNGIKDLAAGIYTVQYTDNNNCTASESIEVFGAEEIIVNETIVEASCSNIADGSISLEISNAISPYNFILWVNEDGEEVGNEESISNLSSGDYTVTIEDGNGCQYTNTFTVMAPEEITIAVDDVQPILCFNGSNGAINISTIGGNGVFQYTWSGTPNNPSPNNIQDVSGLSAGTYTVVAQSGSCQSTEIITLDPASEIELTFEVTPISCADSDDGSIDMTVTGGALSAQSIEWTGPTCFIGANTEDISGLCPGTYFVLYTDANGCEQSGTVEIDAQEAILIEGEISNVDCYGNSTGAIDITLPGATGSPTYQWDGPDSFPGSNSEDITDLFAGEYSVEVNIDGCITSESFTVTESDSIYIDEVITPFPCNGNVLGAIDITPYGGVGSYTYFWTGIDSPDNTNEDQPNLDAGSYLVIVTDSLGCFVQKEYNIAPTTDIDIDGLVTNITCFGQNNGEISTDPNGGEPPYNFAWSGPNLFSNNVDQNISDLSPGEYELTVSDFDGCLVDTIMNVLEPVEIQINVTSTDPTCGNNNGSITVNTTGGVGITNVSVTKDGVPIADLSNLEAGLYLVEAEDGNNCTSTQNVTLSNSEIDISGTVQDVNCYGNNSGAIDIIINGAVGTPVISWVGDGPINNPNGANITDLIAGEYVATVSDDNGCESSEIFIVVENDEILIAVDVVDNFCDSSSDGSISVSETIGGQEGYIYTWNSLIHDDFESQFIENLPSGSYELTVTDALNCSKTFTYEISSAVQIDVLANITNVNCFGDSSGEIDISVSGGTPSYEFDWLGTSNSEDLEDLSAGEYFLVITDENGCVKDTSFIVTSSTELFGGAEIVDVACAGDNTGSISLVDLGGSPPFVFSWSSNGFSSSNQNITDIISGMYNLNITDSLNCQFDSTFTVLENNEIIVDAEVTHVDCYGTNSGSIMIINAMGGVGNLSPTWSPMPDGSVIVEDGITNLPAGDYLLTITDEIGCTTSQTYTVLNLNGPILITADVTNVFCAGQDDGTIEIFIEGGVPDYAISWTSIGNDTPIINNLSPGSYPLNVSDNLGCSIDTSFMVSETNPLVLDLISIQNNMCAGDGTGAIDINISGGSPEYSFTWTNSNGFFETSEDITNLDGDVYTVHVVDFNQCELDQAFTIEEPQEIQFDLSIINSNCSLDDGSAEVLDITGGSVTSDYTVNWYNDALMPIGTGSSIENLPPGGYSVVVFDDNDCHIEELFSISDNTGELASLILPISCPGVNDGEITVSISGLTRPISFEWTSDLGFTSTDSMITNLATDNYTITVTDNIGCQIVEVINLSDPEPIDITSIVSHESCPDANDGSINIIASGGTGEFTYAWTGVGIVNPQNQDQDNLPPGMYELNITDENNCSETFEFIINPASEFVIVADINHVTCFDLNDASIIITTDFGTSPPIDELTYFWQGPNVVVDQKDQYNLAAGTYDLTVITPNGCIVQNSFIVDDANEITIDVSTSNSTCIMENGGAIVSADGGSVSVDYQYVWYEGSGNVIPETSNTLENVSAGLYEVSVSDDNNCAVNQSFVISDDGGELTYVVDSISCPGLSDGSIDITYSGLNEPVGILWSGPSGGYNPTDEDISNLSAGDYTVLITSIDGCVLGDIISVNEQDFISSYASINDVSCFGNVDGAINITVDGGTLEYTLDWIGPNGEVESDNNGDIANVSAGDYSVSITDSQGCEGFGLFTIQEPEEISIISGQQDATCFGSNDGFINIADVQGGTGIYEFQWTQSENPDFNSTFQLINDLSAGTYNLTITDSNGCVFTESFTIDHNSQISLELLTEDANCGLPSGSASVTASGGTNSFSYQWYDNTGFALDEDSESITGLVQGSYSVVVTDDNGCSENLMFSIQNTDYGVTEEVSHVDCFDGNDGEISITLSDDFSFPIMDLTWSGPNLPDPPPAELTISNLTAGLYTLSLADANGCPFTENYEVLQPDSINIASIIGDVLCFGESTGSIVISPTGGTPYENVDPAYNFEWTVPVGVDNPGNIHFSESLPTGNYTVNVLDSLNCLNTINIELTEPDELSLIAAVNSPVCESDTDGSIQVIVSGGIEGDGYDYDWSNDEIEDTIENLTIGDYNVVITDDNDCQLDSTFTIEANIILNLAYDLEDVSCNNLGDGSIDLNPSGGSDDFTYNWNAETDSNVVNDPSQDLTNLLGGEYYLTLTDVVNGCVKNDTIIITNPDSLYANVVLVQEPLCNGESTGIIDLQTIGGTTPYTYDWVSSDPAFDQDGDSIINLIAGSYNLEITDSSNCTNNYEFLLNEPELLLWALEDVQNPFCYTSEDGSISTSISGGVPGYTVEWLNDQGFEFSGENITGLIAGNYYLQITDVNNCVAQDTVLLNFEEEVIAIIQNQDPACDQLSVTLDGTESIGATTYTWIDNEGQNVGNEALTDVVLSLNYDEFILEISNGVCSHQDTLSLIVNALPPIDAGEDLTAFPEEDIEIGGNPSGPTAISFLWEPGELLSDSTDSNPTYFNIGTQLFYLTITDNNNCKNSDSILVTLINEVVIPDGFSPNDDGKNDAWVITNSDKFPDMIVKVFSRWGDMLFESKGYNTPWNGTYENGFVPVGTYYYVIELKDPMFPNPYTGPLTIFR